MVLKLSFFHTQLSLFDCEDMGHHRHGLVHWTADLAACSLSKSGSYSPARSSSSSPCRASASTIREELYFPLCGQIKHISELICSTGWWVWVFLFVYKRCQAAPAMWTVALLNYDHRLHVFSVFIFVMLFILMCVCVYCGSKPNCPSGTLFFFLFFPPECIY